MNTDVPNKKPLGRGVIVYGVGNCAFHLQYSIFYFYYVKVFVNIYKIEEQWFHYSQLMYLVVNFINVPVSSYIQDYTSLRCTRTRRENFLFCAPFATLSFLVPWMIRGHNSWSIGIHLIVSLVFWDCMMTYIGLASSCLFTETSNNQHDRLKLIQAGNVGSLIGKCGVALTEYMSHSVGNFYYFQLTICFIALVCWILLTYVGFYGETQYDNRRDNSELLEKKKMTSFWKLIWQIVSLRDFQTFTAMNFLQEFHTSFQNSFAIIICDQLVTDDVVPVEVRSVFYGALPIIPTVFSIFATPCISESGYYQVTKLSFICKMLGSMVMLTVGRHHPWIIMLFILFDQCLTKCIYSLFNIPLSDITDQDCKAYNRSHPMSSLVFGTNSVIVKAATALSPMLVVCMLNRHGYQEITKNGIPNKEMPVLYDTMFSLLCFLPFVMGFLQLIIWSMYCTKENKVVPT